MVIGASIAGLCAARVLSDFYSTVTVFERDELPEAPANRATVPQDRHLHMLMARGAQEFDSLFPGLLHDMVAAGVPMLENRPDCIYLGAAGHVLGTGHTLRKEFTAYVPSRPHLEWQLRRRVLQLSNVQIVRRLVTEPQFERRQQRVVGVLLDSPGSGQDREREEFIAADLVVDAAGRTWNGSCGDGSCSSPTSRLCGAWSPSHSSSAGSSEWSACCWIPLVAAKIGNAKSS
ncbi:2-polyprenyl-6-methoxyphenol hydroxylase-like oxidoreductase [Mycobacterium tuberculosis]|nr:2-polyprenyl-6-methoxyphenol hydroxylase-like oxidoreductase [Mycobacterium tuberculosis]